MMINWSSSAAISPAIRTASAVSALNPLEYSRIAGGQATLGLGQGGHGRAHFKNGQPHRLGVEEVWRIW